MDETTDAHRFALADPRAFVVPAEDLGPRGMALDFASQLLAARRLDAARLQCLDRGYTLYWQRAQELFADAPGSWFAPRHVNLLVADDAAVPPYFDPFGGSSSLLYLSDLDTHPEYVAFALLHNERVAMLRSLRAALICNLGYWLRRNVRALQCFDTAARRARRPDAAMYLRLAEAFEWIAQLRHATLRPPEPESNESFLPIPEAELLVPKRLRQPLLDLCDGAQAALHDAMARSRTPSPSRTAPAARAARACVDRLCDWLIDAGAQVVVRDPSGAELWQPGASNADAMRRAMATACDDADDGGAAITSLHEDLRVIHERSSAVLAALVEPASLPRASTVLVEGDGCWLDPARHTIVYALRQPSFDTRRLPAPPYHRPLLGARVVHEWGHLAHGAGLLRVPPERRAEFWQRRATLGDCFLRVLHRVPARLRAQVTHELESLAPAGAERGAALARKTLARVGDYLANRLCARLLPAVELQAYVRANVRSHVGENLGLVDELARYAYEIHYLALAGLPRSYFHAVSRFDDYFVRSGLVAEGDAHALFDAAGEVLACYEFDEQAWRFGAAAVAVPGSVAA